MEEACSEALKAQFRFKKAVGAKGAAQLFPSFSFFPLLFSFSLFPRIRPEAKGRHCILGVYRAHSTSEKAALRHVCSVANVDSQVQRDIAAAIPSAYRATKNRPILDSA